MKPLSDIIRIWYHELTTVMRDKGILIFIVFVPLAYPLLYSYVYTNEVVREVPAAVVDESNTALSRRFTRMVDAAPDVSVRARCADMAEAEELLKRQEVYGIIRIPASFGRDLWLGEQTRVGVYCDMCSMLYYKALMLTATNVSLEMNKDIKVERYIRSTTAREEEISRMPIEYEQPALYNPQSGFAAFLIPPVLMLIIQQTLLLLSGISWPGASIPAFWKYVSWLFPSTFGMNGYVRIQGMGASLADISREWCGLWIQTAVYFLLACWIYKREEGRVLKRKREE